jgi:hypothetical protein
MNPREVIPESIKPMVESTPEDLETKKQCKDAIEYVELNKKVVVPAEHVSEETKKLKENKEGWMRNNVLYFIDSDGSIAEIAFDLDKISSLHYKKQDDVDSAFNSSELRKELEKYGFKLKDVQSDSFEIINRPLREYQQIKLEQADKKSQK